MAHLVEQGLERDVLDLVLLLDAGLERALLGEFAGIAGILKYTELVACGRHGVEAEDLDASEGHAASLCSPCWSSMARTEP